MITTTKNDVLNNIKEAAEDAGFKFINDNWGPRIEDSTHTVNFTITENADFSKAKSGYISATIKIRASIAMMGGNPDAFELEQQGATIMEAARLIRKFDYATKNGYMTYRVDLKEE